MVKVTALSLAIEIFASDWLDDKEKEVMRDSFINGTTLKEIGVGLGVTESRVSQIRSEAVRKIRCKLRVI